MNQLITHEDVLTVIKSFLSCNDGEEAVLLILSIGSELLDVSVDRLQEMLND